MNRAEKKEWIADVNESVGASEIVIVAKYQGLTVAEMSKLRREIRKAGAHFRVTKNRLTRLALDGTQYDALKDLFKGPTAVAYANDPVSAAKAMATFAKENEKLVLVGGAFGSQVLSEKAIKELATLPSLDELRAKILALINTPATRIAGVLQAPAGQLARVFGAYGAKE